MGIWSFITGQSESAVGQDYEKTVIVRDNDGSIMGVGTARSGFGNRATPAGVDAEAQARAEADANRHQG